MAHITNKEFYDEYDNITQIEKTAKKPRYAKAFKFLLHHFNKNQKPWVTPSILQEELCIPEHAEAYQILESLRILNLLTKYIDKKRKVAFYHQTNKPYWENAKKVIEDGK